MGHKSISSLMSNPVFSSRHDSKSRLPSRSPARSAWVEGRKGFCLSRLSWSVHDSARPACLTASLLALTKQVNRNRTVNKWHFEFELSGKNERSGQIGEQLWMWKSAEAWGRWRTWTATASCDRRWHGCSWVQGYLRDLNWYLKSWGSFKGKLFLCQLRKSPKIPTTCNN